jgi:predicted nucleotidyltransferase
MASTPPFELETIAALTARERLLIAASRGGVVPSESIPDKVGALVDTARALERAGVRFALIGGVAVGIHSRVPRATVDTDLAISTRADRSAVKAALADSGFRLVGEFAHSLNFRHASGEPVQLAFDPAFDPMIDRAERLSIGGVSIPLVTRADLIAMKRRAAADPGRRRSKALRDQADVELLEGDVPDPDEGW